MEYNNIELDRESRTPLYLQLKQTLLKAIWNKELVPGDLLPSEGNFSQMLGISKATIRQCMSELSNEGYIEKRRNRGTLVLNQKLNLGYSNSITSFQERVKQMGMVPKTELLHLSVENCDARIAELLRLKEGEAVIHLCRLRSADNLPILYINSYLPYAKNHFIMGHDLQHESIYNLLDLEPSSRIDHVTRTVFATEASQEIADHFHVPCGCAMLTVETLAYNGQGDRMEYSISYSPKDRNQYTFTVNRL